MSRGSVVARGRGPSEQVLDERDLRCVVSHWEYVTRREGFAVSCGFMRRGFPWVGLAALGTKRQNPCVKKFLCQGHLLLHLGRLP